MNLSTLEAIGRIVEASFDAINTTHGAPELGAAKDDEYWERWRRLGSDIRKYKVQLRKYEDGGNEPFVAALRNIIDQLESELRSLEMTHAVDRPRDPRDPRKHPRPSFRFGQ